MITTSIAKEETTIVESNYGYFRFHHYIEAHRVGRPHPWLVFCIQSNTNDLTNWNFGVPETGH